MRGMSKCGLLVNEVLFDDKSDQVIGKLSALDEVVSSWSTRFLVVSKTALYPDARRVRDPGFFSANST